MYKVKVFQSRYIYLQFSSQQGCKFTINVEFAKATERNVRDNKFTPRGEVLDQWAKGEYNDDMPQSKELAKKGIKDFSFMFDRGAKTTYLSLAKKVDQI